MKKTDAAASGKTPQNILDCINNAKNKLQAGLVAIFGVAYKAYQNLQAGGAKGELRYCYISFLRSGIASQSALFHISLCDENDRMDLTECAAMWDTAFLTAAIYKDIPMVSPAVPAPDDLAPWEIEALWVTEAEKYFSCLADVMPELVTPLRTEHPQVQFFYGEYMDAAHHI